MPIQHDIEYSILVIEAEHELEFVFKTDTPYLALGGKLWSVYCEELEKIDHNITTPHCN